MKYLEDFSLTFKNKKILITGGVGFIGSNLARTLIDLGSEVTIVDSLIPDYGGNLFNINGYEPKLRLNISDVRDQYSMNYLVQGYDLLFNLAGQISHTDSMKNPFNDLAINVQAQLSILEACKNYNPRLRIVFASTRQIYGRPLYLPVDEDHPILPVDVNGINKVSAEWYHMLYGKIYQMQVTCLRLTNTYGPRMRIKDARQTFLGWWVRQLVMGEPIEIFGNGEQLRDFNYVDDVIQALLLSASHSNAIGKIYNLGNDPVKLIDLARMMISICRSGSYELVPFPEERKVIDIGDYYGSYKKIANDLNWKPEIDIHEGIENLLAYYTEFYPHYL